MPWNRNCPGRGKELLGAEDRLVASIEQVRQGMVPLDRAQQALFALVDSLAKILLTSIPEPDERALAAAVARAQGRHARLLKSAGLHSASGYGSKRIAKPCGEVVEPISDFVVSVLIAAAVFRT
jgi:hypothetical protein